MEDNPYGGESGGGFGSQAWFGMNSGNPISNDLGVGSDGLMGFSQYITQAIIKSKAMTMQAMTDVAYGNQGTEVDFKNGRITGYDGAIGGSDEIRSIVGKVIKNGYINLANTIDFDLSSQPPGIYFISVNYGTREIKQKFVKK